MTRIGIVAEAPGENRVAATPTTVPKLLALGYDVVVEAGAGAASSFPDAAYEAAGADTSVFQHIWSLSVQGQFYLLWPVLTIVAVVVARRLGMRARTAMIVVSVLVMAASFPFAVYMHHAQQANAYLNTGTRLWQLAFGALIALLGAEVLPRAIRPVTGWIGLLLIITCGFFLDGGQLFPGPWALWPVLGFALVMWSEHDARWGVTRVLQLRPFAWVGDISYAFYLWHWPILVLWISHSGHERVGLLEAVGILALAITLAQLTLRLVERPVTARLGSRPGPAMAPARAGPAIRRHWPRPAAGSARSTSSRPSRTPAAPPTR